MSRKALVARSSERFFRPPYVGHRGWLGVYLDVDDVDWEEIAEIVVDYRQIAPKSLVERLPAGPSSQTPLKPRDGRGSPDQARPDGLSGATVTRGGRASSARVNGARVGPKIAPRTSQPRMTVSQSTARLLGGGAAKQGDAQRTNAAEVRPRR